MKKLSVLLLFFFLNYDNAGRAQTTIMIGGTEYQVDTLSHFKVGPGSYYTALHYYTSHFSDWHLDNFSYNFVFYNCLCFSSLYADSLLQYNL